VRAAQAFGDLRAPYPAFERPDPLGYGRSRRKLYSPACARDRRRGDVRISRRRPARARAAARCRARCAFRRSHSPLCRIDTLRDAGVAYVEDHVRERVYGMSHQSARAWAIDQAKATAIAAVVTVVLTVLAEAAIARAPRRWPWLAIAATPPLLALATVIAPTFVMPLFNRYEPLTGELEERIRALAARYGVGDAAILRFDMSRQTAKANAFVTGVLGTERIALADTLIDTFSADEILFVVAHELGHYVRRDTWRGIAVATVAVALMILGADALLRRTTGRDVDSAAQGARLAFYAQLVTLVLGPLTNAASREIERRADRFAVAATNDACRRARLPPARRAEPGRIRSAALGGAAVRLPSVAGVADSRPGGFGLVLVARRVLVDPPHERRGRLHRVAEDRKRTLRLQLAVVNVARDQEIAGAQQAARAGASWRNRAA
jgi:Zn-dependent protease with chaperone function